MITQLYLTLVQLSVARIGIIVRDIFQAPCSLLRPLPISPRLSLKVQQSIQKWRNEILHDISTPTRVITANKLGILLHWKLKLFTFLAGHGPGNQTNLYVIIRGTAVRMLLSESEPSSFLDILSKLTTYHYCYHHNNQVKTFTRNNC